MSVRTFFHDFKLAVKETPKMFFSPLLNTSDAGQRSDTPTKTDVRTNKSRRRDGFQKINVIKASKRRVK